MNKKLVIINGAPGIGKIQTCRALQPFLERSFWPDGDWCWMANPWIVTTETKRVCPIRRTVGYTSFPKDNRSADQESAQAVGAPSDTGYNETFAVTAE